MKTGEYYKSKWNGYVSKITNIYLDKIILKDVFTGIVDEVAITNFKMNWEPCISVYQWSDLFETLFTNQQIMYFSDTIKIKDDTSLVEFSIDDNMLMVSFTDDVKEVVDSDSNTMRFLIDDANEVIEMFAELFE